MEQEPGQERLDAHVAGQKIALTSNNLIAIFFIGLIGVLIWLFAGSGQVILQRDLADRHRIAQEHQQEFVALRQAHADLLLRLERYHATEMERSLEVARALLRLLLRLEHNLRHPGTVDELPFGELPPWFTAPPKPVP